MELIATQPGFKYVNEPLHPDHLIACGVAKPPASDVWKLLLPHDDRQTLLEPYLRSIEQNRVHIGEPRFLSQFYRLRTNRIVFKLLRAKDLISWFQDVFGWQVVYLLRHPVATNLSRKQFPRLEAFLQNERFVSTFLTREQFRFARQIQAHGTELQAGVLDWCLQNIPVLKNFDKSDWLLMHYEDLVCRPTVEIERLSNALVLEQPELIGRQLSKASGSTFQSNTSTRAAFDAPNNTPSSEFLISQWRDRLSPSYEEDAFQVLDAFEIDIYSRGSDQPVRRRSTTAGNDRGLTSNKAADQCLGC